jgi:homogentisate 1,2-dioxygenase
MSSFEAAYAVAPIPVSADTAVLITPQATVAAVLCEIGRLHDGNAEFEFSPDGLVFRAEFPIDAGKIVTMPIAA